jgi:Zn(2)-Cys(6) binuclear cluster domain-containing protein
MERSPSSLDKDDDTGSGGPETPDKPAATRSRTGCQTCRTRHLKCDETKPTCDHCRKGNRDCQWGLVLKFKHKRYPIVHKIRHPAVIQKEYAAPEGVWKFEDNSVSIASEYINGIESYGYSETPQRNFHDAIDFNQDMAVSHLNENLSYTPPSTLNASVFPHGATSQLGPMYPSGRQNILPSLQGLGLYNYQEPNAFPQSEASLYTGAQYQSPTSYMPSKDQPIEIDSELYLTKIFIYAIGTWMDLANCVEYVRIFLRFILTF